LSFLVTDRKFCCFVVTLNVSPLEYIIFFWTVLSYLCSIRCDLLFFLSLLYCSCPGRIITDGSKPLTKRAMNIRLMSMLVVGLLICSIWATFSYLKDLHDGVALSLTLTTIVPSRVLASIDELPRCYIRKKAIFDSVC
jgi:hypothetical protein